jgi:hypothetical protein
MELQYLTEDGIRDLKGNFITYLPHYLEGDREFFARLLAAKGYLQDTGYDFQNFRSDMRVAADGDKDGLASNDAHNAIILYEALKKLPLYMAADEKIWTAVCHTWLFDFVCQRRRAAFDTKKADYERAIYNSFFTYTHNGKRRGTFVNCVSSLWWGAHMVYDPLATDPYAFVHELAATGFASTSVLISSSRIMGRKDNCLALFQVIHDLRMAGHSVKRQYLVEGIKYLNLVAGLTILDSKSREEIQKALQDFYAGYLSGQE